MDTINPAPTKKEYGLAKWQKLKKIYAFKEISETNGVILFSFRNTQYYFGVVKQRVRQKGTKQWGKLFEIIQDLPKIKNSTIFRFGKHLGKTIEEVYDIDKQYLIWVVGGGANAVAKPKFIDNINIYLSEKVDETTTEPQAIQEPEPELYQVNHNIQFKFGKYIGRSIIDIFRTDLPYLKWFRHNTSATTEEEKTILFNIDNILNLYQEA